MRLDDMKKSIEQRVNKIKEVELKIKNTSDTIYLLYLCDESLQIKLKLADYIVENYTFD